MSQQNPNRDAALADLADSLGADTTAPPAAAAAPAAPATPAAPAAPASITDPGPSFAGAVDLAKEDPTGIPGHVGSGAVKTGNDFARGFTTLGNLAVRVGESVGNMATAAGNAIDSAPAALGAAARGAGVDRPSTMQPGLIPTTTAAVEAPPAPEDEPEAGPGAAGTPHG